ncbi:hypothetical protein GCM10010411_78930 [Actinomadura fulvescens]|uniref:Uncharacterized protein n=1 Tax=Actinomadura fulvescens TaxID=46160 RepID=A0ABN3QLC6_9ACTN
MSGGDAFGRETFTDEASHSETVVDQVGGVEGKAVGAASCRGADEGRSAAGLRVRPGTSPGRSFISGGSRFVCAPAREPPCGSAL